MHNAELVAIPHSFVFIGCIVDIVLLHHRVKVSNFMLLPTRRRNVVIFQNLDFRTRSPTLWLRMYAHLGSCIADLYTISNKTKTAPKRITS